MNTMNTLILTDYQLETIKHACEVMDRLMGGQIGIALYEAYNSFPNGNLKWMDHDERDEITKQFAESCVKDDSPCKSGGSSWNGNTRAFCAREIKQTIHQEMSLRLNPEGGVTTNFQDPFMISGQPKPVLSKITQNKL